MTTFAPQPLVDRKPLVRLQTVGRYVRPVALLALLAAWLITAQMAAPAHSPANFASHWEQTLHWVTLAGFVGCLIHTRPRAATRPLWLLLSLLPMGIGVLAYVVSEGFRPANRDPRATRTA